MIARSLLPLLFTFWTGLGPTGGDAPNGEVDEVRIAASGSQTEITIRTQGAVQARDFLLQDPPRLIVDLEGARHGLERHAFGGIARGGVVRLRSSQFREDVVRLVFDLSRPVDYSVESRDGSVRVRFANPGGSFAAWSSGSSDGEVAAATPSAGGASASASSGPAGANRPPAEDGAPREGVRRTGGPAEFSPQQSQQPRISVRYDSANVLDVIAGFSDFSGTSIVPGAGVSEKVVRGVDIQNQPWDVALDAILQSQGLGWKRMESGIILVDDLSDIRSRDTLQTQTRVFRINYAGADTVANALQNLTSSKGQVVAYEATNSVIVTDAPSVVTRMDSLVGVLDRRTPQVSIEAKIVFVDRTNINQLGLVYDLKERDGGQLETGINDLIGAPTPDPTDDPSETTNETIVNFAGESVAALANANNRLTSPALSILASTAFGDFSLFAFLDALQQHRLSDVQAAPSIQVADNHQARIQVGERTPIRVLEPSAQLQNAQVNVQFEDTGIILEVTPHVTNNNQILLDLMAERSAINTDVAADLGFTFDKQVGESRLLLNDGETAVIGGLTLSSVTRQETGIPGLMNIPLLGNLFRTTSETEQKQDLIILVTPHIVGSPPPASGGQTAVAPGAS